MSEKQIDRCFEIRASTDPLYCSIQSKKIASQSGFESRGQWEIAIAVKELVTNAFSHAGGGRCTIRSRREGENGAQPQISLEIEVEDNGPGISDVSQAVMDGYSRGRFVNAENFDPRRESLGTGLGTVQRLMDSVTFQNKPEGGLVVRARKYLRPRDGRP